MSFVSANDSLLFDLVINFELLILQIAIERFQIAYY